MRFEPPPEREQPPVEVEDTDDVMPWWRQYGLVVIIGLIFVPACIIYTWIYFPDWGW